MDSRLFELMGAGAELKRRGWQSAIYSEKRAKVLADLLVRLGGPGRCSIFRLGDGSGRVLLMERGGGTHLENVEVYALNIIEGHCRAQAADDIERLTKLVWQ